MLADTFHEVGSYHGTFSVQSYWTRYCGEMHMACTWLYLLSKHMFHPLHLYPGTFARTLQSVCTLWPIKIANFLNSMKVFYQCHDPRSKIVLFGICSKNPNFALFLFKSGYVVPYTLKEHVLSSQIIPDQNNYVSVLLLIRYKVSLIHVSNLYIVGTQ